MSIDKINSFSKSIKDDFDICVEKGIIKVIESTSKHGGKIELCYTNKELVDEVLKVINTEVVSEFMKDNKITVKLSKDNKIVVSELNTEFESLLAKELDGKLDMSSSIWSGYVFVTLLRRKIGTPECRSNKFTMTKEEILNNLLEDGGHWLLLKSKSKDVLKDLKDLDIKSHNIRFKIYKKEINVVVVEVIDGFSIPDFLELKYDLGIKEDINKFIEDYNLEVKR